MKVRNELAKTAVMDFLTETFNGFEFSFQNVAALVAVKLYVHNNFDKILPLVSKDGYIDLDVLDAVIIPEAERLGKIEIPGIGTRYTFGPDDVKKLMQKLKQKAEQ